MMPQDEGGHGHDTEGPGQCQQLPMHETAESRERLDVPGPPQGPGKTLHIQLTNELELLRGQNGHAQPGAATKDAAIAKDVMEEYATNHNLQKRLNLKKIEKIIKAKESAKKSMVELTRTQEEPHLTTNKLRNYHKAKNLELHKIRDNQTIYEEITGRSGTQPDSRLKFK